MYKKSDYFWTGILVAVLLLSLIWGTIVVTGFAFIGSIVAIIYLGATPVGEYPPLWVFLTPIIWILLIAVAICEGFKWCFVHTVGKFNNWLNKEK